ncbi:Retrotransposable element [Operophtera brumata]|uniref:Retrotransposable element n=1 Tax=Operophtera brumata TaxID=104452 RepID=A0A0L7K2L4_OPEBR|nr:Retrotransposable element [Operophtera brumata]
MHSSVVKFISRCDTCLAYKLSTHGTLGKMGRPKNVSPPFQVLSIDLVGPLPNTRKQNKYIFVVTCCFSKYCICFHFTEPLLILLASTYKTMFFSCMAFLRLPISTVAFSCKKYERYSLRRKDAEFNVGDIVWKRFYFQSDKDAYFCKILAPKFIKCKYEGTEQERTE